MNKCFVIMPISMPAQYAEQYGDNEHFDHVLNHLFAPALQSIGYAAVPPAAVGADLIHAEIIRNLEESELVLCDISTLNPNVFFELGIRTSLDRPVVLVRDNLTTHIPFDTGSINTYTYDPALTPWTLAVEVQKLAAHIGESAKKSGGRNSLWRYFGLTQRASPADISNPTEAKLDLLLSQVRSLTRRQDEPSGTRASAALRIKSPMSVRTNVTNKMVKDVFAKADANLLVATIPAKSGRFFSRAKALFENQADVPLSLVGYSRGDDVIVMQVENAVFDGELLLSLQDYADHEDVNYILLVPKE